MRCPMVATACLLCVSLTWLPVVGQEEKASQEGTTRNVEVTNVVPTQVDQVSTIIPDQCDADANIYMRPYGMGYRYG